MCLFNSRKYAEHNGNSMETQEENNSNKNIKMSSFKSSENIQKKEGGPDRCVVQFRPWCQV